MKGKICKDGNLSIYRKNKLRSQYCPYDSEAACGDYCPMFSEPVKSLNGFMLELCKTSLFFDEFTDERG